MIVYNDAISEYITHLFAQEDPALEQIRRMTPEKGLPDIAISPEEGQFLHLLVRSLRAERSLEIGTLGGYSGTWIARALIPGGKLITLEKSAKHAAVAREHFQLSGVSERVEIRHGVALELLPGLAEAAPFDFAFIDADKLSYPAYYEWVVEHLRPGGILAAHNALWGGAVVSDYQEGAIADMKAFNKMVAADARVSSTIYPAGDGTLVAVKIG